MKFTSIDIAEINLKDERFRISYHLSFDNLMKSIQEVGLINPPVLTYRDDQPIVVSGWNRILACQRLSLTPIPVFISETQDDLETFKIPVYENLIHREYSHLEKAEILYKLKFFGEGDRSLVRQFLPLLQIPPTQKHLALYLTFARFDPALKRAIQEKILHFDVLRMLTLFNSKERKALLSYLTPVGQNKQRELLINLFEITRRERISATDILSSESVKNIRSDNKLSSLQKANRFLVFLRERRNPALSSWQKAFEAVLKHLNLSHGVVITPSPFFEGEDFFLNFSFTSREDFIEKVTGLKDLSTKKEFSDLFKFSSDD